MCLAQRFRARLLRKAAVPSLPPKVFRAHSAELSNDEREMILSALRWYLYASGRITAEGVEEIKRIVIKLGGNPDFL
jgi:hypothetical protein